jgi:UPF0755 protein
VKALRVILILLVLAALAAGGILWKLRADVLAFAAAPFGTEAEKTIEIPSGASGHAVLKLLVKDGVLADETLAWRWFKYVKKDPRPLKHGEYVFAGKQKPDEVLERIYKGEVKTYHFTVPEGLRMDEIAPLIEKSGLVPVGSMLKLMRDPKVAAELGVPQANLEGYLFPDTYTFPRGPKPTAVLKSMVERFREEYRKADAGRLDWVKLSEKEAVILASIIEKETGKPDERPRISCVFHNRLKKHDLLRTDPTVLYAMMLRDGAFPPDKNIHESDLHMQHPYSTYWVKGLPPGPIANPGAAALQAALHPSDCGSDYFFVSRNDGSHVFCPTYDCHLSNVQKFQVEPHKKKKGKK